MAFSLSKKLGELARHSHNMAKRKRSNGAKKSTGKRRRTSVKNRPRRILPLGGNPMSKLVRLRYVQQVSLNAAAGASAVHIFRANSLFDPDVAVGGHQPQGFDQQMFYYNHFKVIGSKISAQFMPDITSSTNPSYMGIVLSSDGTSVLAAANVEALLESRILGRNNKRPLILGGIVSGYGTKQPMVSRKFSAKRFFRNQFNAGDLIGDVASDPVEQAFYEVFASSVGGNDPGVINVLVTIDYIAILSEPRRIAQS